jgi:L-asparaginase
MNETAAYIQENLPVGKKIILTGAMIPIAGFASSDAGFNLGFAIGSINSVDDGVYVAMNGGIFAPNQVSKNTNKLRFE